MEICIETPGLWLSPPSTSELDEIYHLQSDPVVMKYITGTGRTHEQVVEMLTKSIDHYKKHGFTFFSVYEKQSGRFIGQGGLIYLALDDSQPEIEVGYRFTQDAWGKGYATELAKACIDWGFQHLKLDEIVAVTHPENFGSQHVLQKAGMVRGKDRVYFEKPVFSFVIKNPNNK